MTWSGASSGEHFLASNPPPEATVGVGAAVYDKGGQIFNAKAYNGGALTDVTLNAAIADGIAQLSIPNVSVKGFIVWAGSGDWQISNPVVYTPNVDQHGIKIMGTGKFGTRFYLHADLAFGRAMFEMNGPTTVALSWRLSGCRILSYDIDGTLHKGVGLWTRYVDEVDCRDVYFNGFALQPAVVHGYKTTEFIGERVHFDECSGFDRKPTAATSTTITDASGMIPGQIQQWGVNVWANGFCTVYGGTSTVFAGTATSATATTIVDSAKTWTVNQFIGCKVRVRNVAAAGGGYSQVKTVTANTATALTVASWDTDASGTSQQPVAGSTYELQTPTVSITSNTATVLTMAALAFTPDTGCVYHLTGPVLYANANGSDWAVQIHGTDLAGTLQTNGTYTGNTAPQFIGDHIRYVNVNVEDGHGGFLFAEDQNTTNLKLQHGWVENNSRSQQPLVRLNGPQWPHFHDMIFATNGAGHITIDRDPGTNQTRQPVFYGCMFRRPNGGEGGELIGSGAPSINIVYAIDASFVGNSWRVCGNGDLFTPQANGASIHMWGNSSDWLSSSPGRKMHCTVDSGAVGGIYRGEVNGGIVVNGPASFGGNLLDLLIGGSSKFSVDDNGNVVLANGTISATNGLYGNNGGGLYLNAVGATGGVFFRTNNGGSFIGSIDNTGRYQGYATGTAKSGITFGTGVPAGGTNQDIYVRFDGGGAGATHIYYNNAGTWLGIA